LIDAGLFRSLLSGRRGRGTNSPPQLGQLPDNTFVAQSTQNVHSKEQINTSVASAGKSLSQHSQFGLNSSIITLIKVDALY